jgi:hypothetical protein
MAVLMVWPAISRGTGLPANACPFTVTVASWQPTKRLGIWCMPVADLSGGRDEAERLAEPAPSEPHGQITGFYRLAISS